MKTLRLVFIVLYSFWAAFILGLLVNSMPYNPLSSDDLYKEITVRNFLPEGWGFFTKNPRDPDVIILKKRNGRWHNNEYSPLSNPTNFFGISRVARAQSTEMAMLVSQIGPELWTECTEGMTSCLTNEARGKLVSLELKVPHPVLKDTVCFISQRPVPWAWREIMTREKYPFSFVIVAIQP
jgi:antimicrobial peptide system SdpA family protein